VPVENLRRDRIMRQMHMERWGLRPATVQGTNRLVLLEGSGHSRVAHRRSDLQLVRGGRKQGVQHVSLDAAGRRPGWGHSPGRLNDLHHPVRGRRKPGDVLEEHRHQVIGRTIRHGRVLAALVAACMWMTVLSHAQNRGVYPLGMGCVANGILRTFRCRPKTLGGP
jgi:hypothetical protein